jgi:hypothetical protein
MAQFCPQRAPPVPWRLLTKLVQFNTHITWLDNECWYVYMGGGGGVRMAVSGVLRLTH